MDQGLVMNQEYAIVTTTVMPSQVQDILEGIAQVLLVLAAINASMLVAILNVVNDIIVV